MAQVHAENYLTVRKLFPRWTGRPVSRLDVAPPGTTEERDYRDLLSEANENYFHREYAIALQNYLSLRQKILVQSHPEMPSVPGSEWAVAVDVTKIEPGPLMELGRRYLERAAPDLPITIDLGDQPVVQPGDFPVNTAVESLVRRNGAVAPGLDPGETALEARRLVAARMVEDAHRLYARAADDAAGRGDHRLAAEILTEAGALAATYATGPARERLLPGAAASFDRAAALFHELGDTSAESVARANLANVRSEMAPAAEAPRGPLLSEDLIRSIRPAGAAPAAAPAAARTATEAPAAPAPGDAGAATRAGPVYLTADRGSWVAADALVGNGARLAAERRVGIYLPGGIEEIALDRSTFEQDLRQRVYSPRTDAQTLDALDFREEVEPNFVAYIPHLFFFTLPIAIGDTYLALGRYEKALEEYRAARAYAFLNRGIEAAFVWLRMAKVYLRWGDELFRQDNPAAAKTQYENIISTDVSVPMTSPLYQPQVFASMRGAVTEVSNELRGQPHGPVNPKVAELVIQAHIQLQKIANGLNFLGLAADYWPVFRFRYLQGVANYLADNAIQAERTFVSFRTAAENQKLERIQLENAVEVNRSAVAVEQKRLEDAALERTAARQSREYAQLRRTHADQTYTDWTTLGWELATVNAALAWASNAANDQKIRYTGVRYDGRSHDFDTDVEEFYDVVGEWRENLNYEIQRRRLDRQRSELAAEVAITQTREQQAQVRYEIQTLSVALAQKRLEGAVEMLDYARDRMFDEDLWFRLAGELQDLSRQYLDMAIYAAFLMERAYDLEFDRNLRRIRLDYGIGGVDGLLGGDYLKRDIASFALDYLQNAQKKNPTRLTLSLRGEFPAAFQTFVAEGILPFRTDLEIFDRRYPGTYRRKVKKVEVFVEGLIPLEGVHGTLLHQGVSTEWRLVDGSWTKHTRVLPPERLVLSSYQFRRDLTVFQPSEETLDIFENAGPQGNWTLELPRSDNNLDYEAISDVKLVLYFDADHSDGLAAHVAGYYPNDGGRSLVLTSRFHFPDEYFRLDPDREVTFTLHPGRFAYNHANLRLRGFGVRLVPRPGMSLGAQSVTVTRAADGSSVTGTTNADGLLLGDATTMAPFDAWRDGSPVDEFTVALDAGIDPQTVDDIQLFVDYAFDYRPDGSLPA